MIQKVLKSRALEQVLYSGQSFLSVVIVSHLYNVTEFGTYSLVVFVSMLASNVLISATFYPMVPVRGKMEAAQCAHYDDFVSGIVLAVLVLSLIGSVLFFNLWNDYTGYESFVVATFLTLRICFEYTRRYQLIVGSCFKSSMLSGALTATMIGVYGLNTYSNIKVTFQPFILTVVAFYLVSQKGFLLRSVRVFRLNNTRKNFNEHFPAHAREAKWLVMTALTQIFSGNYFLIAVSAQLGAFHLGAFRAVQNITNLFNPVIAYCDNSIYVKANGIKYSGGAYKQYIITNCLKVVLLLVLPLTMISFFSFEILELMYGLEISKYGQLVSVFSLSVVTACLNSFFRLYLRIEGINNSTFFSNLIASIGSVLCAPYVVESYGLIGAAWGIWGGQFVALLMVVCHYVIKVKGMKIED